MAMFFDLWTVPKLSLHGVSIRDSRFHESVRGRWVELGNSGHLAKMLLNKSGAGMEAKTRAGRGRRRSDKEEWGVEYVWGREDEDMEGTGSVMEGEEVFKEGEEGEEEWKEEEIKFDIAREEYEAKAMAGVRNSPRMGEAERVGDYGKEEGKEEWKGKGEKEGQGGEESRRIAIAKRAVEEVLEREGLPRNIVEEVVQKCPLFLEGLLKREEELSETEAAFAESGIRVRRKGLGDIGFPRINVLSEVGTAPIGAGAEGLVRMDTFKERLVGILEDEGRKGGRGGVREALLESVSVKPSQLNRVLRYCAHQTAGEINDKLSFLREILNSGRASPSKETLSTIVRRSLARLGVDIHQSDLHLQQTLSYFQKLEAQRDGLGVLDCPISALPSLLEAFPEILQQSVEDQLRPVTECLVSSFGVRSDDVARVLICFPSILLMAAHPTLLSKKGELKQIGIRVKDMGSMVARYPFLLSTSLLLNLRPTVDILISLQVPRGKTVSLLAKCPRILGLSRAAIDSVVKRLKEIGLDGNYLGRALIQSPHLLLRLPSEIDQVLGWLESQGLTKEDMCHIVIRAPMVLCISSISSSLIPKHLFLLKLSIPLRSIPRVIRSFPEILITSVETMEKRVSFLQNRGFSEGDVAFMVVRFPPLLGYNGETVLATKLDFLENEMGLSMHEVVTFPAFFSFSLERIKRRWRIVSGRVTKNSGPRLRDFLACSDATFAERYLGLGSGLVVGPLNESRS